MRLHNFVIIVFAAHLFFACNNNKRDLKVADLTIEDSVDDPGRPLTDTNEVIKRFNEYTKFKKSGPITVDAPKTKPSNTDIKDPDFLKINILRENYAITFLNKTLPTNNLNELETFLQKKGRINKNKVFVAGFDNSEKQQNFVKLLSRYGISKFNVSSN